MFLPVGIANKDAFVFFHVMLDALPAKIKMATFK